MSKNTNSTKSIKTESPKTPGGISKSLLTPCRRVGLSRSWRNKGPSPFISPITNSQRNTDEQSTPREKNSRKRKKSLEKDDQENENESCTSTINYTETENSQTPTRTNVIRKRSKTLLSKVTHESKCESPLEEKESEKKNYEIKKEQHAGVKISKLSRNNSKNKLINSESTQKQCLNKENKLIKNSTPQKHERTEKSNSEKAKSKSPQNLTTECVVVIQKELFRSNNSLEVKNKPEKDPKPSQGLFDSDSDDVPLCQINKDSKDISAETKKTAQEIPDNTNSTKVNNDMRIVTKLSKLEDKKTSTTDLKTITKKSKLSRKNSKTEVIKIEYKPSSQSSFDDEDDDDFDHRRTIVVKKTYDKVAKPSKAKSTGSITDKDIEELKTRIEVKKKLLLAKSLDSDTKDIRDLIRKWQRGCQDALVELMELMKKKMPDQPNMENAQILEMLKIPADLVGYDSENDCFNSPNDTNIILSSLKI